MKGEEGLNRLAEVLKILANPTRLRILMLCAEKERSTRELREMLGISKPLLLAHLKKLKHHKLIEARVVVEGDRGIVKLYRTVNFRICISPEELMDYVE